MVVVGWFFPVHSYFISVVSEENKFQMPTITTAKQRQLSLARRRQTRLPPCHLFMGQRKHANNSMAHSLSRYCCSLSAHSHSICVCNWLQICVRRRRENGSHTPIWDWADFSTAFFFAQPQWFSRGGWRCSAVAMLQTAPPPPSSPTSAPPSEAECYFCARRVPFAWCGGGRRAAGHHHARRARSTHVCVCVCGIINGFAGVVLRTPPPNPPPNPLTVHLYRQCTRIDDLSTKSGLKE